MIALLLAAQAVTIPHASVAQYGMGIQPCAAVRADAGPARASWILGFWTGLNAAFGRSVGKSTTPQGIVAEVERRCATLPTRTLAEVTLATYSQAATLGK